MPGHQFYDTIGSLFLDENITDHLHLTILYDGINPMITQVVENSIYQISMSEEKSVSRQNDCPAHYKNDIRY